MNCRSYTFTTIVLYVIMCYKPIQINTTVWLTIIFVSLDLVSCFPDKRIFMIKDFSQIVQINPICFQSYALLSEETSTEVK